MIHVVVHIMSGCCVEVDVTKEDGTEIPFELEIVDHDCEEVGDG